MTFWINEQEIEAMTYHELADQLIIDSRGSEDPDRWLGLWEDKLREDDEFIPERFFEDVATNIYFQTNVSAKKLGKRINRRNTRLLIYIMTKKIEQL